MKKTITLLFCLLLTTHLQANTDSRTWTLVAGESFTAALISYDKENAKVKLQQGEKEAVDYPLADLNEVDKQWLKKWRKIQDEMTIALAKVKGEFFHSQTVGKYAVDYYTYYPSSYNSSNEKLPLLLLFSPSGKGQRLLKRHIEAAEKVGMIILAPDVFRNHVSFEILDPIFEELLSTIKSSIDYDENSFFMGGSSGGAMNAYGWTSKYPGSWTGIYANGGWLGGYDYYDWPYPAGLKIAMLNGHKDRGVNRWAPRDKKLLEKLGSKVQIFSFEGGHQIADVATQIKAMTWLIEGSKLYEGFTVDKELLFDTHFIEAEQLIVSSKKAFKAAERIFTQVRFTGLSRKEVLAMLGDPEKLNSFNEAKEKEANSPLVYVLHDGQSEEHWTLIFVNDKVVEVKHDT
ncbi:MAG: hypothetical protein HRT88_13830 [Lentisphaeraceae bacterium]|nr:hypothetical protein [Lentisphaeraceae bacterium]